MPIFDTHCHYNLAPLSENVAAFSQEALARDVTQALTVGTDLASSQAAIAIAASQAHVYASVGIHPENLAQVSSLNEQIAALQALLAKPKVIAVGETGLDYYRLSAEERAAQRDAQRDLLVAQLILAKNHQLPVVLHVRDNIDQAYLETLELVKQHADLGNSLIFHCVSGPLTYIDEALALPHSYFGFDGNLTFKNADNLREIFRLVQDHDPSRLLLETDAPFLAPVPHRGKVCEPAMIADTAAYAAQTLGADLEQIYQNSLTAFHLGSAAASTV